MDFDVYRYDDGYAVVVFQPLAAEEEEYRGLTRDETRAMLLERGGHPRDILELLQEADAAYARGTTEFSRGIVRAWRHARAGVATENDIAVVRQELTENRRGGRRTYLINALHMAGYQDEALGLMIDLLDHSQAYDDLELALRFVAEWSPEAYERVGLRFIRGEELDKQVRPQWAASGVRGWAMTYAGSLIRQRKAPTLLDELARIATDPQADAIARKDARNAIAEAAGQGIMDPMPMLLESSEENVAWLIVRARERLQSP